MNPVGRLAAVCDLQMTACLVTTAAAAKFNGWIACIWLLIYESLYFAGISALYLHRWNGLGQPLF